MKKKIAAIGEGSVKRGEKLIFHFAPGNQKIYTFEKNATVQLVITRSKDRSFFQCFFMINGSPRYIISRNFRSFDVNAGDTLEISVDHDVLEPSVLLYVDESENTSPKRIFNRHSQMSGAMAGAV